MTTPNHPPLWEVMYEAFWQCPKENWRLSSAYMIRALRDWLIQQCRDEGIDQDARNGIYGMLTAEADRAESRSSNGNVPHHLQR